MIDPDECPTCGVYISDHDIRGCEAPWGQRYCIRHLPKVAPSGGEYRIGENADWLRQVHQGET